MYILVYAMMRRVTQKSRYRPNTNTENQKRTDLRAKSTLLQLVLSPSFHGTSEMDPKRWGRRRDAASAFGPYFCSEDTEHEDVLKIAIGPSKDARRTVQRG